MKSMIEISLKILQNHLQFNNNDGRFNNASGNFTGMLKPFTVEEVKLYIKYAKSKKPTISEDSKKELIDRYTSLRQESLINSNNYKMTVRHLESLIRLSEALAKIHNDSAVNIQYIQEAYRLLKSSLIEIKSEDIVLTCKESTEPFSIKNKDYLKISNSLIYLIKTSNYDKEDLCMKYLELI